MYNMKKDRKSPNTGAFLHTTELKIDKPIVSKNSMQTFVLSEVFVIFWLIQG